LVGTGAVDCGLEGKAGDPAVRSPPVFCLCFPLTAETATCSGTDRQWVAVTGARAALVHRALSSHGGGRMSDNSGGRTRCVEPKLVTRQGVHKRNTCRNWLSCVTGVR
ncbi:hypothetical protein XENOCAPTIV_023178, partial [Xenoophorus captivus]